MLEHGILQTDIFMKDQMILPHLFISIRIPFRLIEGKIVSSSITFDKLIWTKEELEVLYLQRWTWKPPAFLFI